MTPDEKQHWIGVYADPDRGLVNMLHQLKSHPTAYDPMYEWDKFLAAAPFDVVVAETYHLMQVRMSDEHRAHCASFSERCHEAAKAGDKTALEQAGTEFGAMVAEAIREVAAAPKLRKI